MLDPLGYATFRRWRLYGQEALAGSEAALWLQEKPLGKHLEKMRGYGESAKHKLSENKTESRIYLNRDAQFWEWCG
jgi:hypothetical protein